MCEARTDADARVLLLFLWLTNRKPNLTPAMNIFEFGFAGFILVGGIVGAFTGYAWNGGLGALLGIFAGAVLGLAIASLITLVLAVCLKIAFGGRVFPRR
jgi:hypothetical protein